jgi:hypothetical protein
VFEGLEIEDSSLVDSRRNMAVLLFVDNMLYNSCILFAR